MLRWKRLGHLFNPLDDAYDGQYLSHAQSPQAVVFDDYVRIYFSTRIADGDKVSSHVAYIDMDQTLNSIIRQSDHEIIPLGELGCFDEHGIFPFSPFQDGKDLWAYTCGWSRRVSVSVETATGLARSTDGGETFQKIGNGPVFASSLHEPMLVGDSFVRKYDDQYHMWYMFGTKWVKETEDSAPDRVYKIGHAVSDDGVNWNPEYRSIISDKLHGNECLALPSVIKHHGYYHMVFCYRDVFGFRDDPQRGYQIGYARSFDLQHWVRDDSVVADLYDSDDEWDKDMKCYPHLMESQGQVYLLYNGNQFGREGFGAAILNDDKSGISLHYNTSKRDDILAHLHECGEGFYQDLASRVDVEHYADKLIQKACRYELWQDKKLVCFLAVYTNQEEQFDFISNISTACSHQKQGLAKIAMRIHEQNAIVLGQKYIELEVLSKNTQALSLYDGLGYTPYTESEDRLILRKNFY